MRYLSIDYGNKRTGLAICDEMEILASPLKMLQTDNSLLRHIAKIIIEEGVHEIVIGLPINMDGSEGPQAKIVKNFAERLQEATGLPIHFQDERLSSYLADEMLGSDMNWRRKKKVLDAVAAANILRSFLDRKSLGN